MKVSSAGSLSAGCTPSCHTKLLIINFQSGIPSSGNTVSLIVSILCQRPVLHCTLRRVSYVKSHQTQDQARQKSIMVRNGLCDCSTPTSLQLSSAVIICSLEC